MGFPAFLLFHKGACMATKRVSIERLKEALEYDPEAGELKWKVASGSASPRETAGTKHNRGYVAIGLDGTVMLAHRAAWALTHGHWPEAEIDHRDGDRANNKLANLREATHAQNMTNLALARNNSSGVTGVDFMIRKNVWRASIWVDGKKKHLGVFKRKDDAVDARLRAQASIRPFQPKPRYMEAQP